MKASGLSLDTLLGWRFRADIARARAVAALILRREAGLTANEAGRILRRSRQSVHSLTDRAAASGGDPAAAELVTHALRLLWEPSESASSTSKRLPPRRPTHSLPGLVGCRLGAGLTQAELVARAGISRETLLRLEHGRPGTTESIARLAGALMVPIRVLTRDPKWDRHVTARFRTCSTCHQLKWLTRFTPIKGCRGYYGRCRVCRAEAAKQRYHSNEQARLADIERARRNRQHKQIAAAQPGVEWVHLEDPHDAHQTVGSFLVGQPADALPTYRERR